VLDPRRQTVRRGETPVLLTSREFALLEHLMRNADQTLSKEQILKDVWGDAAGRDPNLVEVYIGYLRRKIDEPFGTDSLGTVRGVGYRLRAG